MAHRGGLQHQPEPVVIPRPVTEQVPVRVVESTSARSMVEALVGQDSDRGSPAVADQLTACVRVR